ncbi:MULTISPECIES: TRAM domain-containing protein [unclassified Microbacterium]|uniref:class I SAM-dependent RNA methyltransferase n=1 Tax=unclassified Microbacterium TaxID=2609290 RepID=UPI00214CE0F4|nr:MULTISPECIES: TRAM domain-containing protein [unclassified Microbacterium]MCR2810293.1 class I SAM-dependent RNA methyltransferase [Microbacterium sp. zg.B185]WIM19880.1 class I SAM-dependent RNA methyltransferase [Microbacterium sp. zg-B185]
MDAGDELDLDVTSVAHGGVFVGRYGDDSTAADRGAEETRGAARGGRVIFVPDAIPGERVRVRLTDVGKKSFWRGDVIDVLEPSPHRQPHVWRQADVTVPPHLRPGGADFGHIELAHQRALKREVLTDALQRFGGVEWDVDVAGPVGVTDAEGRIVEAETADGTRWRTRVSLHVDADGHVGPYAARSHTVVPVEDFPLATAAVERAALQQTHGRPGRIDLVQPADGRVRVLPRPDSARHAPGQAREVVTERVGTREFRVDAGGFWQVHRLAAATLDSAVRSAVRAAGPRGAEDAVLDAEAWHLDLYGGVGLFAAALAELGGGRVTSVESDPRATEHAGENLAEWVGARAETARVDRFLARLGAEASDRDRDRLSHGVTVLDPPRSGAGRGIVERIAALRPAAVVYVACDPVALARDVATFRAEGYSLSRIAAYDIFPNSHHVEAVATFVR